MCSCEGPVFGDWIYAGALWADDYRSRPPNKKDGRDYLVGGFNPSEKYKNGNLP